MEFAGTSLTSRVREMKGVDRMSKSEQAKTTQKSGERRSHTCDFRVQPLYNCSSLGDILLVYPSSEHPGILV